MNDSVWTPARESAGVRAFMATLRLHSMQWHWEELPERAGWWIIDASAGPDVPALLQRYEQLVEKPRVAFLTPQLMQLPHPAWTFFKPPVQSGLIFNWIRPDRASTAPARAAAVVDTDMPQPWRHGLVGLRRWPNVNRYGGALGLTVACSRMLAAPTRFDQLLHGGDVSEASLDALLADAHAQGLLIIEPFTPAVDTRPATATPPPATTEREHSRWDLVRRLLGKFARS